MFTLYRKTNQNKASVTEVQEKAVYTQETGSSEGKGGEERGGENGEERKKEKN